MERKTVVKKRVARDFSLQPFAHSVYKAVHPAAPPKGAGASGKPLPAPQGGSLPYQRAKWKEKQL
jgi:hypothetical protein